MRGCVFSKCCILCKHCHEHKWSKKYVRLECDEDCMPNMGVFDPYSTAERCWYYEEKRHGEGENIGV